MDPAANSEDILRQRRSKDRKYAFDHAFGPDVTQQELFAHTTQVWGAGMESMTESTVAPPQRRTWCTQSDNNRIAILRNDTPLVDAGSRGMRVCKREHGVCG